MKFKFIANACGVFTSKSGKTILTDPWINDGVFEGSWCHFHKLDTKITDLQSVDAIYLSHIHPDHYDPRFFDYDKNIPIFLLDHAFPFLYKNLEAKGYKNLINIKDEDTVNFEDFKITLYKPFVSNNYFEKEAVVGNLIDSAMVVESDGFVAFNANDNTPDTFACEKIIERFGRVDLAMLNYNAAGPYPSCFNNLSEDEKINEHKNNLIRNYEYLLENLKVLKPKIMLPFAGAYVLGGKLSYKNKYLGTGTWDECAKFLNEKIDFDTKTICLRENDEVDIKTMTTNRPYIPIDQNEVNFYIEDSLSSIVYEYEKDDYPDLDILKKDIILASAKMKDRCKKISLNPDMDVSIKIDKLELDICNTLNPKGKLLCSMDTRLLRRILDRISHWNNAEIGCHIEFERKPNYYSPDIHTMLQFYHL